MARDFQREAFAEQEQRSLMQRWIEARTEVIRNHVTVHDVLTRHGVMVRGDGREEQISCPFHGTDNRPSARVYPSSGRSLSHVWCFVCQERWDSIALWRKYTDTNQKFTRTLMEMEKAFGIIPPEAPPVQKFEDDYVDPDILIVDQLFDVCESRLKGARSSFDMKGYLTIGSILDRLRYQLNQDQVSYTKAKTVLNQVLQKIGEKVR